jgi:adenylylsulfate reductase subunit B
VRACPGDIVAKDFERERAFLRCASECWDCYACVKACPRRAVQVELSYALARREGRLLLLDYGTQGAVWEIRWPDGRAERILRPINAAALEKAEETSVDVFFGRGI